jgi:hypothetical protein
MSMAARDHRFGWQQLETRIGDYLEREGAPSSVAARLSHAAIRIHAESADSIDHGQLSDRIMDEAQTLLETWQAGRREQVPVHS